jgi:moderate conductance mechanosensitive channel
MNELFQEDFWTELYDKAADWMIESGPPILITIILFFVVLRLFNYLVGRVRDFIAKKTEERGGEDRLEKEKRINTLINIFKQAGKILIFIIFGTMLLQKFGVDIGPILASAGILGLAIGFGSQELVRDVISGFFILLENQVRAGDVAIINGTGGLVEKIELRTITLRDFAGTVHIIQNGKINTMSNMTKEWAAAVFDIGVAYKENVDAVIEVIKQVGEELRNDEEFKEHIINELEVFGLDQFGDSAVVIKARLKTKPGQQWMIGRQFKGRLKKAFDAKNIEIPFPHTTVYWGEEINPLRLKVEEMNKSNKLD